jgi:hypothetical protein
METRLWERHGAPPIVDRAPGADAPPPYLVVCRRPPDEAQAGQDSQDSDEQEDVLVDPATTVVYQWVRQIPR